MSLIFWFAGLRPLAIFFARGFLFLVGGWLVVSSWWNNLVPSAKLIKRIMNIEQEILNEES